MKRLVGALIVGATLGSAWADPDGGAQSASGATAVAEPVRRPCANVPDVAVRAAVASDARAVCDGAARALAFLARAGLAAPAGTEVDVVDALPGELGGRAVGCYRRDTRGIQMLSYAAFEAIGAWFRTPVDRELYRSAAAHEMAHAIVGCNAAPDRLPVAAHEYVAYVVLFATMDPGLRERVLAKFPGPGFTSTLQISDIGHLADPNRFGVDAWLHYLGRRDREAWLRSVIAGEVVQEVTGEAP